MVPFLSEKYISEECYFQQNGAALHYYNSVKGFLNSHLPGRWFYLE
jgi:hypothetical protein